MTNQEKKRWLNRYREADNEIGDLLREKERVMSRLTRMTANLSGMPRGGGGDGTAAGMDRLMELDQEIDRKIDTLVDVRAEVVGCIDALADERLRRLMRLRYIEGLNWGRIADSMMLDNRWVYRLHGKALSILTIESHY